MVREDAGTATMRKKSCSCCCCWGLVLLILARRIAAARQNEEEQKKGKEQRREYTGADTVVRKNTDCMYRASEQALGVPEQLRQCNEQKCMHHTSTTWQCIHYRQEYHRVNGSVLTPAVHAKTYKVLPLT